MLMLKKAGVSNIMTETWLCDSLEEVNNIPENTPAGSIALLLTDEGLTVQMKK